MFFRFIISLMTSPDYYEAWQCVPLLLCSTVFSCLATFIGSIYTMEKKSVSQLVTTLVGAVSNIVLNLILIPRFGISGAAIATLVSFMLVFIIRLIDTRNYWSPVRFCISFVLLMIQIVVMINDWGSVYIIQSVCLAGLIAVNFSPLLSGIKKLIRLR